MESKASLWSLSCHIHSKWAAIQFLSIKGRNSIIELLLGGHGNKTKSPRTPRFSIVDNRSVNHLSMLAEQLQQPRVIHLPWQVANISPESRSKLPWRSLHTRAPWSRPVYVQKPSVDIIAVKHLNGLVGFLNRTHGNEPKSTALPCLSVVNDLNKNNNWVIGNTEP
jgi:hypothetical protein